MTCLGDQMTLDFIGIRLLHRFTHGRGDKVIALAVDDRDRHGRLFDLLSGRRLVDIEAAENQRRELDDWPAQIWVKVDLLAHMADDQLGIVEGAIGDNTLDVIGELLSRRHQHRAAAHRDAVQVDGAVFAEPLARVMNP